MARPAGAILGAMQPPALYITQPGRYTYTDPGGAPEAVDVVLDAGELCVRFTGDEGDIELVDIADMAGIFTAAGSAPA